MVDEPDRIDEALRGTLRVGLTVAGQLAERALRAREQSAREAQARSEQEARTLQARLDSERAAARAALAPVDRDEWWQSAQPADITRAWETAQTWRELDPDARRAGERIHDELQRRYGIDTRDLQADPAAVRAALERAERTRSQSERRARRGRRRTRRGLGARRRRRPARRSPRGRSARRRARPC